ncbi:Na/Pi cotransporter family protein [Fulvivirga sp. 29W222]|uniref:Na/Pi cotransporter family protein n=1 Tax=Fulvivirga marina TaxID=2494733 RepID=A0A937KBS4_9BACT|nr:Na/Pi symporter [Fulvivirga marina]MBL6446642.1 Na/Pi cotransporter family protein [Fulvivirga marina]
MIEIWRFLAGVGLFLYGMDMLENVLKKLAGRSFKLFLRRYTQRLFTSVTGGALITGLLQSSSVVSLLVLAFVESGIISFKNALGVILGANVGTTLSSWIVATVGFKLDIESYSLPVIAISAIAMFFLHKQKQLYHSAKLFLSLGLLFLGLSFMKAGAEIIVEGVDLGQYAHYGSLIFVLIGFIITTLIQSSSATVAITLTALYTGVLDLNMAAAVVIGSELGTTIKIVLSGVRGSADKKRVAWSNFFFNVATSIIAFLLLPWLIIFIRDIILITDPLLALVAFQTTINLLSIIMFMPFIHWFAKWLEYMFKASDGDEVSFITQNLPVVPELAIDAMYHEAENLSKKNLEFLKLAVAGSSRPSGEHFFSHLKSLAQSRISDEEMYGKLKQTEGDILEYYAILQSEDLVTEQYDLLNKYITAVRNNIHAAKSLKDIHHDLKEFGNTANDTLYEHYNQIKKSWLEFDASFQRLMAIDDHALLFEELTTVMKAAFVHYNDQNLLIIEELKGKKLSEVETSTLMNVQREILSAKKSQLRALAYLKLTANQAHEFEFLPEF